MAKRKLLPLEIKIIERDIKAKKDYKDFLVERFISDCQVVNEDIRLMQNILYAGEVEAEE